MFNGPKSVPLKMYFFSLRYKIFYLYPECKLYELFFQHACLPALMFFTGTTFSISLPGEIQHIIHDQVHCNVPF